MQGYYNNPEASANATDEEGFFKSGDIGYFDESGGLYVVDRKKEILKYKNYHFNPSEIENVIATITGVELVSVVGIPDQFVGDKAVAAVVKRNGLKGLAEKEIVDYVAQSLPDEHKHLHGGVVFVDELPMTLSGKVQRKLVKEMITKIRKIS